MKFIFLIFNIIIYILFILYKINYSRIISILYSNVKILTNPKVFQITNLLLLDLTTPSLPRNTVPLLPFKGGSHLPVEAVPRSSPLLQLSQPSNLLPRLTVRLRLLTLLRFQVSTHCEARDSIRTVQIRTDRILILGELLRENSTGHRITIKERNKKMKSPLFIFFTKMIINLSLSLSL
jgi:hypothetical protein